MTIRKKLKKVVLAYSGGLDTSCAVRWIRDTYDAQVICFSAFIGESKNKDMLAARAKSAGASKVYVRDLKDEFAADFLLPALWAHARYEGKYPLATALGRPLIAKHLVDIARREGASYVSHGCTGKGNDQVRIEVAVKSLYPRLKVIAPLREWAFRSREEEIDYAKKHQISIAVTKANPYSIDKNIWGTAIEAGVLEDPWVEPPADTFLTIEPPRRAPRKPAYVIIGFERGVPVSVNGKKMKLVELIERLNRTGARYGIGRIDQMENRLVGIKSREIYEAPAATILLEAHEELEALVFDRELAHYKRVVSEKYSELVYYGLWFTPLREALDSFFATHQNRVTGEVRIKLEAGRSSVVGRQSPFSVYSKRLATYTDKDEFDRNAAEGFMKVWGLPYEGRARSSGRTRG